MTVKQRLSRSNIYMFLIPLLIAAALLLVGAGIALYVLETVYLPKIGLSLQEMHITLEQYESMFAKFEVFLWVYLGAVGMALLTIMFTNVFLTRSLFGTFPSRWSCWSQAWSVWSMEIWTRQSPTPARMITLKTVFHQRTGRTGQSESVAVPQAQTAAGQVRDRGGRPAPDRYRGAHGRGARRAADADQQGVRAAAVSGAAPEPGFQPRGSL